MSPKNYMQRITLAIVSCLLCAYSFSQPLQNTDSIQAKTAFTKKKNEDDSLKRIDKTQLNIYPNPAKNKVTLQVQGFETGIASVRILDSKGKLLRDDSRLLTIGDEDIIMFLMLPPGIYFIIVSEKRKVARRKLVIL
jgi:hypothetical protein